MKKVLGAILAFSMMFSLAACGGQGKDSSGSASASAASGEAANSTSATSDLSDQSLMIYCGAGMQQPFQKIADAFEKETGCKMNVTYANAAQIQTQIKESKEGDFFIAGSADEVKPVKDNVSGSVDLVKHIPVLAVAKGNPKGITGIADLGKKGVVTVIGDPTSTPIGKIAKKVFSDFGVSKTVTLGATTTTAPQLATVVGLKEADAAIIWKENCNADGVEICKTKDLDNYVKTIPAARLNFSKKSKAADAFSTYLGSDAANRIWSAHGYELVG